MSRRITIVLIISLLFTVPVFADYEDAAGIEIPNSIRNNSFFLESIRLTRLAQETFEYGDYDASTGFAEEAIRYVQLSNEYIADQLISEAGRHLDWANSNNIAASNPYGYSQASSYYEASIQAQADADWEAAIAAAVKSIEIFTILEEGGIIYSPEDGSGSLPGQYTVRPWAISRDCLWNIAGYSWVYGDSRKWTILYDANKSSMPNPNNPDLIHPGMVLEIPSISGEARGGMWDPNATYER